MEIGSVMQFTEEHSNKDGLYKLPFSIAERPKQEKIVPEPLNEICKEPNNIDLENNESQDVVENFIIDTLNNNNPKDKIHLLKIEKELIIFLKSESLQILKFPEMSSYNRMLVHKVAAHFGLDHNVDLIGNSVIVAKTWKSQIPSKRFQDHITDANIEEESNYGSMVPTKRSILKRNTCELIVNKETNMEKTLKSLEEREEEYQQARARIFKDSCLDNNLLNNELETSEMLKEIDASLTQDERDMLTIPPSQNASIDIRTAVTTHEPNVIELQQNKVNLDIAPHTEQGLSTSCEGVVKPSLTSLSVCKEIVYVKSEKKKPKRSKSKVNMQVIDYNQNSLKHLDLNLVSCANNLHKNNPQYVASILENLQLADMKNTSTFVSHNCQSHDLNQINYKQIPMNYTPNYNYSNKEYIAPSVNLLNNNLLGSNISINTNLTQHSQLSINPNHYSNYKMELNSNGPNFIQIQPNYGPQKNVGSNSILPIPTVQPFTTLAPQYTNLFNTQIFSIPAKPHPSLINSALTTTYSSWQSGINQVVSQGMMPSSLEYGSSLNNLATCCKLGIFPNPPLLFSGACSNYNNNQPSKNVKQVPLRYPYPNPLSASGGNTLSSHLPLPNHCTTFNLQPTLATTLNPAKNQVYITQLRPYSNCYNNPIAPGMKNLTQQHIAQMNMNNVGNNQYLPAYLNPHLLNNLPAPPLINQVKTSQSQNNFPKVPVPLMAQNINPMGLQPSLLKSNAMGMSTLQMDIIKFQNSMGIHKPHHLHGQGYHNQNINTKHGKNIKHNRTHNESKKRGMTPKVPKEETSGSTTPTLNPEAIKDGTPSPSTATVNPDALEGAKSDDVETKG